MANITNYKCPACTGPLHFVGVSNKLECDYCGSKYEISEIDALYTSEVKSEVETEEKTEEWDSEQMKAYNCPSCGAELICDETTVATSCPYCGNLDDKVLESRTMVNGESIRRRRECIACGYRFTSYERIDEKPFMVVKRDERRQPFDRVKLEKGIERALEKRPFSIGMVEQISNDIEDEAIKFIQILKKHL